MPTQPYNPYFMNRGSDPDQDQVALFIDWDNLVISNYADRGANRPNIEVIIQKAQQYGTVVIARAYAEWTVMIDRLEVYKTGVEPIYAPVFHSDRDLSGQTGKGKSLADPVMVADCIDFLHLLPQVGTYVLVTGDKDMMPVVRLAKLRGRRVVVIGPDYVANVLQQVCDEFVPYRMLLAAATQVDPYAAYYQPQQPGAYYPPQPQPGLPQGYYPPQMPQTAQSGNDTRSRSGRRLSSGRRTSAPQPYKDVAPPQQPPMQPSPYGYYYGAPQMMPPQGYPGGAAPQGYPPQVSGQNYPPQPAPGYPEAQANPVIPQQYQQPVQAPQQYQQPIPAPQQYQPVPAPQQYQQPVQAPQQYQPSVPVAPQAPPVPARPVAPAPVQAQVAPPTAAPEQRPGNNFEDVKEVIRAIMGSRAITGRGQMRARDLKEELLRRIPSFNERRYGYSKFKALLNAVEQAGILQMYQSGHILWVAAPGTPKGEEQPEFDETMLNTTGAVVMDELEDDDEDEEEEETESGMALNEEFDAATPVLETQAPFEQLPTVIVEPGDALLEGAIEAPEQEERYMPTPAAEERVTTLAEAPIGAHLQRDRERERRPAQAEPAKSGKPPEKIPGLGARPALLEQPYYEDVIVLVEGLRHRNRWLGYELLLSSVRDYLTKHMSESEAKSQAGAILSKLLNENVLKMAMEVHSRGARKMRVQVAHLQEDHPSVRYAMAAAAARATMAAQAEQAATAEAESAEAQPDMTATLPDGQTPTETGEGEQPQAANALTTPDAQTFEAVAEIVADKAEVTLGVDEGGVPVIQAEAPQGEAATVQPELSAAPSVQPESEAAPFIEAPAPEQSHDGAEPIAPEAQSLQFGEQTQMEGETGQIPQNPEMLIQATDESAEVPQPDRGEEFHPLGSNEEQPQFVQTVEAIPVVEAGGEAGELGYNAEVTPVEQVHDPVPEVTQEQHEHSPEQHDHHEHAPEQHEHSPEQHDHHEHAPEQHDHYHDHAPEQHDNQQHEHGSEQHHEPSSPEQHHEQWAATGEEVTAQVVETPGAEGETGQHVQGEPEHAPPGEDSAPAGGYMNTVEMAMPEAEMVEGNHNTDGAEGEDEVEEVEEEHGVEPIAPGLPARPRRRRRVPRPTNPVAEGGAEMMEQPRERRYRNSTRRPARQPRQAENKRRPTNGDENC